MIKRIQMLLPVAALALAPVFVGSAIAAPAPAWQRALDVQEIQNMMGLHVWYHAHFLNNVEIDKAWVTTRPYTDTAVWAQNSNYWQGLDNIRAYYGPQVDQKGQAGAFQFHTLTSPVIVVADDRKTAKGVWYTPGIIGTYSNKMWLWERYGVDFVNENGHWKIWHLHVYTDFGGPGPGSMGGTGGPPGAGGPPGMGGPPGAGGPPPSAEKFGNESAQAGGPPPGGPPGGPPGAGPGGPGAGPGPGLPPNMAKPSYSAKIGYRELAANSYPVLIPRPPEAYKTFSETWSYADPDEYAKALEAIGAN